jgi:1-deoxy-D-xylulose-5-phosphate reductoisomerase
MGGTASCVLNAADEVAVGAFLEGRIGFPAIASVVEKTLEQMPLKTASSVADILEADAAARRVARNVIETNPKVFASARSVHSGSLPAQA